MTQDIYANILISGPQLGGNALSDATRDFYNQYGATKREIILTSRKNNADILTELKGKIDSKTVISIKAHGNLENGQHYLALRALGINPTPTSEFFALLSQASDAPLQVHLYSCYSGNIENIRSLPKNSVVITHSKKNYPAIESLGFQTNVRDQNDNPYAGFIQSFSLQASQHAKFIERDGNTFVINPTYSVLLSEHNAREFLENEAERFVNFAATKTWNGNPVSLSKPLISEQDVGEFSGNFFLYCAMNGEASFVQFLKENLEENDHLLSLLQYHNEGSHPLNMAVYRGNEVLVRLFLEYGADADMPGQFEFTSLHVATKFGHKKIAELLVDYGADVNALSNDGQSPLCIAIKNSQLEIVNYLKEQNAITYEGMPYICNEFSKKALESPKVQTLQDASNIFNEWSLAALESNKITYSDEAARYINSAVNLAALASDKIKGPWEAKEIKNDFNLRALAYTKIKNAYEARDYNDEATLKTLEIEKVINIYDSNAWLNICSKNPFCQEALKSHKVARVVDAVKITNAISLQALDSDKVDNVYQAAYIDNEYSLMALRSNIIKYAYDAKKIDTEEKLQAFLCAKDAITDFCPIVDVFKVLDYCECY
jgi:hypothetical protein